MWGLVVGGKLTALLAMHVDDLRFAGTESTSRTVADAINDVLLTKQLGEMSWFMGNEYIRDREAGAVNISQTNFIKSVVDRFDVFRTSPIPDSPSVGLRKLDCDDVVEGVPFREVVRSLM